MNNLIEKIDIICRNINIMCPKINFGGCAGFAYYLGKNLSKFGDVKIKTTSSNPKLSLTKIKLKTQREMLNNVWWWEQNRVDFEHVFVEFKYLNKKYYIDSYGVFDGNIKNYYSKIAKGYFTLPQIKNFYDIEIFWNKTFNRALMPTIAKKIETEFKKINTLNIDR